MYTLFLLKLNFLLKFNIVHQVFTVGLYFALLQRSSTAFLQTTSAP